MSGFHPDDPASPDPLHEAPHERLREALGAYALGDLPARDRATVLAHLDGCPPCRAELAEITPTAALLDDVDPSRFGSPVSPPADLGERIRAAVAAEGREREAAHAARAVRHRQRAARHRRARVVLGTAAAAVVLGALGAGALLGRSTAPAPPAAAPVPYEAIPLRPVAGADVAVERAGLVPHTWGVELRMEGSGFVAGETYRAAFRDRQGRLTPAGEFLGTGDAAMTCNLQSALLREEATMVVVRDQAGRPVLRSRLS